MNGLESVERPFFDCAKVVTLEHLYLIGNDSDIIV